MLSQDKYYSIEPINKKVTKEEFYEFLKNYPRKLVCDVCGISEPPAVSYNDFELADRWPYSVVAHTWAYEDEPGSYYYAPEEERDYYIMTNYEEVFNSRTGINTTEYEKKEKEKSKGVLDKYKVVGVQSVTFYKGDEVVMKLDDVGVSSIECDEKARENR